MTEEKDKDIKNSGEKVLKLGDVSDFTIGEIVKKAQRVDKENSENESVLDKYIRQHRGEIEAVKNRALEKYIQTEREKIEQEGDENPSEKNDVTKTPEIQENDFQDDEVLQEKVTETAVSSKAPEEVQVEEAPAENNFKEKHKSEFDEVEVTDAASPAVPVPLVSPEVKTVGAQDAVDFPELSNQAPKTEKHSEKIVPTAEDTRLETPKKEQDNLLRNEKRVVASETKAESVPVIAPAESKTTSPEEKDEKRKSKKPLIVGLCALALLAIGGAGYAMYEHNNNQRAAEQAAVTKKENLAAFNKAYDAFFTDEDNLLPKNSNFDKLADLKTKLGKLKDQDLETAEKKVNALEEQINAVKKVNALFNQPAIVDGKLEDTVQVKAAANIPEAPKTANETLNTVLDKAINLAKSQQAEAKAKEEQAAAKAQNNAAATAEQAAAGTDNTAASSNAVSQNAQTQNQAQVSDTNATNTTMPNGAQNPTGAKPDNSNARVQPQPNLNPNDPAFIWNPGIREKVLNIARQRGYISGNNFILLPVAIHTMTSGFMSGQVAGYYNLYRPDGSYLLTINAKTGYFFGNGKGLPTDFG